MDRKFASAAVTALLGIAVPLATAASGVQVGSTVNVTKSQFAGNEESVGMNPAGNWLAGAWNDWHYNDGCGFSYSTNSGQSWAPETFVPGLTSFTNDPSIPGTGSFPIAGDPAVAFNPKFNTFDVVCQAFGGRGGAISLLATAFDPTKANSKADENLSYGAAAWTHPAAISTGASIGIQKGSNGKFPDHESLVVDTSSAAGHHFGRAFVAWAEFDGSGRSPINLAYSDDNGVNWTGPIHVSDTSHKFDQDARVTIGPDGTVYVSFNGGPNETSLKNNFIAIAASPDGGASFGPTYEMGALINPVPGLLPNSRYRVFSDVWSSADPVDNGIVTAVFNDERNGHSNIYAVHNLVAGDLSRWSDPVAVKPSTKEEFFPWVVVSPSGRLDLTFYDRSNDPNDTLTWVDYAASTDKGATWQVATATNSGADLDKYQACVAFLQSASCGVYFIGDYISVVSTDTAVHLVYTWNGPHAMDVYETNLSY
ncbi:MAG TPA: sialidase family protein [Acidimicrobiales bacterium]